MGYFPFFLPKNKVVSAEYYLEYTSFKVAVDCIVFGFDGEGLKLLLIKRNFEPGQGEWSLIGGFLCEDEDLDQAAERVLKECTGMDKVYLEQLMTFSRIGRDPGGRVISCAYCALMDIRKYDSKITDAYEAVWVLLDQMPSLIFDHDLMVEKALLRLRKQASCCPVGFNLLPPKFTLPSLQSLYEAIFGFAVDKRNFRKKILSMNILNNTGKKDYSSSKKGAYLYSFDEKKYREMIKNGDKTNFFMYK